MSLKLTSREFPSLLYLQSNMNELDWFNGIVESFKYPNTFCTKLHVHYAFQGYEQARVGEICEEKKSKSNKSDCDIIKKCNSAFNNF